MYKILSLVYLLTLIASCSKNDIEVNKSNKETSVKIEKEENLKIETGSSIVNEILNIEGNQTANYGSLKYNYSEFHTLSMKVINKNTVDPYNVRVRIPASFVPYVSATLSTGTNLIFTVDPDNNNYYLSQSLNLAKASSSLMTKSITVNLKFNVAKTGLTAQPVGSYNQVVSILVDKTNDDNDAIQSINYNIIYSVAQSSALTDFSTGFIVNPDNTVDVDLGNYIAMDDTKSLGVAKDVTVFNSNQNSAGYKIRKELSDDFVMTVSTDSFIISNKETCTTLANLFSCKMNIKYLNPSASVGIKTSYFYINDTKINLKVNVLAPASKITFDSTKVDTTIFPSQSGISATVGPYKNTDGIKNIRLIFTNNYLLTDSKPKTFSDLVFENVASPFSILSNGCTSLMPEKTCFTTVSFDTTGKANQTYTTNFTFRSPTYPYEIINGTLNVIIDTPIPPAACTLEDASNPLSGISSPNGVKSVSGNFGNCLVSFCNSGYTKATDSKSCIINPTIACSMTNAFAGSDTGLTDATGVKSVKGNMGSCLINACNTGYTKSVDEKFCTANVVEKCSFPTKISPLNNSNGKILTVDTSKDVGSCTILTCASGYKIAANGLSCVADCSNVGVNAEQNHFGITLTNVNQTSEAFEVIGSSCQIKVGSCDSGFTLSGDKKSCIPAVVACDMSNAGANGVTMTGVASVKGDVPSCLVNTCSSGYTKAVDEKSCIQDAIACDMSNASANGVTMTGVASVKGDVPSCLVNTCDAGYTKAVDEKSCIQDAIACDMSNASANGVTMDGVSSVKGSVPSCLVDTCTSGYAKAVDEKSCSPVLLCSLGAAQSGDMSRIAPITGDPSKIEQLTTVPVPTPDFCVVDYDANFSPTCVLYSEQFIASTMGVSTPQYLQDNNLTSQASNYCTPDYKPGGLECNSNGTPIPDFNMPGDKNVGSCEIQSCIAGYHISNNECVPDVSYRVTIARNSSSLGSDYTLTLPSPLASVSFADMADPLLIDVNNLSAGSAISASGICPEFYSCTLEELDGLNGSPLAIQPLDIVGSSLGLLALNSDRHFRLNITSQTVQIKLSAKGDDNVIIDSSGENLVDMALSGSGVSLVSPLLYSVPVSELMANPAGLGISALSATLSNAQAFADCSYQTTNGNIAYPLCATVTIPDLYELKNFSTPNNTIYVDMADKRVMLSSGGTFQTSTPNEIIAMYGPKENTIDSSLINKIINPVGMRNQLSIFPQTEDSIQMYPRFYEKSGERKITSIKISHMLKRAFAPGSSIETGNDFTSSFNIRCLASGQNPTTAVSLSTQPELLGCLMDTASASSFPSISNAVSPGFELTFNYAAIQSAIDAAQTQAEKDAIKDDFRTASYTIRFEITSTDQGGTHTYINNLPIAINIAPDNDFYPVMSLSKIADASPIFDHQGLTAPKVYNPYNDGSDYELGTSTKKYSPSGSSTATTIGSYSNRDYNYEMPYITDGTEVKIALDINSAPNDQIAYNSSIRIFDPRTPGKCRMIENIALSDDFIGSSDITKYKKLSDLSQTEKDAMALYYLFKASTDQMKIFNIVTSGSTMGNIQRTAYSTYYQGGSASLVASGGNNTGCTLGNNTGIQNDTTSTPIFSEKYDFIGNDNWTCEAGEVCYVNKLAETISGAVKIPQRTYRVRGAIRSEYNEINFSFQTVRVEDLTNAPKTNGVNFNVATKVDANMDAPTMDGNNYSLSNPNLSYVDFKSPKNSTVAIDVSGITGISCASGCTYSVYVYGSQDGMATAPSSIFNPMLYTNILSSTGFTAFTNTFTQNITIPNYELANHYVEALVLIKKQNTTYRKVVNISVPNKIHADPIWYMVKSVYNGASFDRFQFSYDASSSATNNFSQAGGINLSAATYTEPMRFTFMTGDQTSAAQSLANGVTYRPNYGFYEQFLGATNTPMDANSLATSSSPVDISVCTPSDSTQSCDAKKAIAYDFYKYSKVFYTGGSTSETPNYDYVPMYTRFKTCPQATPYYFFDYQSNSYGCYNETVAKCNGWVVPANGETRTSLGCQ